MVGGVLPQPDTTQRKMKHTKSCRALKSNYTSINECVCSLKLKLIPAILTQNYVAIVHHVIILGNIPTTPEHIFGKSISKVVNYPLSLRDNNYLMIAWENNDSCYLNTPVLEEILSREVTILS